MLDFTSALYLGFQHASNTLQPWTQLTTGRPAGLREAPLARALARQLAQCQGLAAATLAKSTLHLFWDLFAVLATEPLAIYLDAQLYPTARWGIERLACRQVPVATFAHGNVAALRRLLHHHDPRRRPIIVTNGVCGCCGTVAPLATYQALVRAWGGLLVVDDTQALGILGRPAKGNAAAPYGEGGGGSLPWCGVMGPDCLVVSSLAKGFGVPIAVLAGSEAWITRFQEQSDTRIHCSPPSAAELQATAHALHCNAHSGDTLRRQLAQRVLTLQAQLQRIGLRTQGGLFPIQEVRLPASIDPQRLQAQLQQAGLQTILRRTSCKQPTLTLLITARHQPADIAQAVALLAGQLFDDDSVSYNRSPSMEVYNE